MQSLVKKRKLSFIIGKSRYIVSFTTCLCYNSSVLIAMLCMNKEIRFWNELDEKLMTEEESDEDDSSILLQNKPSWRSESNS